MRPPKQVPVQIRFGDIDAFNHVNNVVYLQYLEDARVELLRTPVASDDASPGGESFNDLIDGRCFLLAARNDITYRAPIPFRAEPVYVNIWLTRLGGSSLDFAYTVTEKDPSVLFAYAMSTMVLTSRDSGRPVRLTDDQRRLLSTWMGPELPGRGAASTKTPSFVGAEEGN